MQVHFTGTNVIVTPAIKEFTTEKLSNLEKRFAHIHSISFSFHIENKDQVVEASLLMDGIEFHAHASHIDTYQSIEMAIHKLLTQMTKHKEKTIDSHRGLKDDTSTDNNFE